MKRSSRKYDNYIGPLFDKLVYEYLKKAKQFGLSAAYFSQKTGTPEQYFSQVNGYYSGRRSEVPRGISDECREKLCDEFAEAAKTHDFSFDPVKFQEAAGLNLMERPLIHTIYHLKRDGILYSTLIAASKENFSKHYFDIYRRGHAVRVEEKTDMIYKELLEAGFCVDDPAIADVFIENGLLKGQAQEVRYSWYERRKPARKTYDEVDRVLDNFKPSTFCQLRAKLCVFRAPLKREEGDFNASLVDCNDGISYANEEGNRSLVAALLRNQGHVYAVQGNRRMWERNLSETKTASKGDYWLQSLYKVMEGNGYKRLAYNPQQPLSLKEREVFAEQALLCFEEAERLAEEAERLAPDPVIDMYTYMSGVDGNVYFRRLFRAQCLIWVDHDEALRELAELYEEVKVLFPAILMKIA